MPKTKRRINQSEKVREAIKDHPDAKAAEISQILAEQGVKVSPRMIYAIRWRMNQASDDQAGTEPANGRRRGRKPGRKPGRRAQGQLASSLDDVFAVIDLAKRLGKENVQRILERI